MSDPITKEQSEILHHALGMHVVDGRVVDYRQHFVTGPGSKDFDLCQSLTTRGLLQDRGPNTLASGDHLFIVTDAGRQVARETFPKPPRLTRSQARYRRFLREDTGLSFGEFLKLGR